MGFKVKKPVISKVIMFLSALGWLTSTGLTTETWGQDANSLVVAPKRVTLQQVATNLTFDAHSSLSPDGRSRLVRTSEESPTTWQLERDGRTYELSSKVCALHGKQPVGWRNDGLAVVIQGKVKKKTEFGSSMEVGFGVLDFKSSQVVDIDSKQYNLLPAWSPNGKFVFAMKVDDRSKMVTLDPTKATVSETERPIKELEDSQNLHPWFTAGRSSSGVMRMNLKTMKRDRMAGGVYEQDVMDVSTDGRYCLTSDDGVSHGQGDATTPPWSVFDYQNRTCISLPQPAGLTDSLGDSQISNDGKWVIALWRVKGNEILGAISVKTDAKPQDWLVLHRWESDDKNRPSGYMIDGQLRWNGGREGWLVSKSGLLQLTFSDD